MSETDRYCIDTSALIHAWWRSYPIRNFQGFWDRIDELIADDRLFSSTEVFRELEKRDDDLLEWAKGRKAIFLEIDDRLQDRIAELLRRYPRLVDTRRNRSAADPFVIAVADVHDPTLVVVSQEGATNNIEKPNIPDVCNAEGIECIRILDVISREDWRFVR